MVNENNEKDLRMIDELTKPEQKAFKALLEGYGKIKYASQLTGLNTRTLGRIAILGTGLRENIAMIREKLLQPANVQAESTPV